MDPVETRIITLRGRRVILDADLARIYGVPTHRLNEAVKRNAARFPGDFAFQATARDVADLISQIAISSAQPVAGKELVTTSPRRPRSVHGGVRKRPWAFTEHGALMAANVLRSPRAVQMSVYVVRAFVKQREELAANAAILLRLAEIDRTLLEHDETLRVLWTKLEPLLAPPPAPPRRRIGFHPQDRVDERASR